MNDLLKYGLLAGGAYLTYRHYFPVATVAVDPPAKNIGLTLDPNPALIDTPSRMMTEAKRLGYSETSLLDWWQWNYLYKAVRGVEGPVASQLGVEPTRKISLDEWWSVAKKAGFGGLRGYVVVPGWGAR